MTQLHSGEMALPQQYADVIRNFAGDTKMGGGDTFHIYAHDSKSFEQFLLQPGNRTAIVRVLRQLSNDRRI